MKEYLDIHETRQSIDEPIVTSYRYGSRVYGCHTEYSDYDYIVIVESDKDLYYSVNLIGINYTVYSASLFIKRIRQHHISALECIFQNENDRFIHLFEVNTDALRREISAVSSNSYVKCKKKIRDGEIYIGKKSLFHSLRILNFGIQIAKYGKIVDYTSANVYHKMIFNMGDDWEQLDKKFKPIYNSMKTLFKKLAPLESEK
jgi:predicted nucleotidyltransferase